MAQTCATLLAENGHSVRLWSPFAESAEQLIQTRQNQRSIPGHQLPASVEITANDEDAFTDAELAVSAIITQYTRRVWKRLASYYPSGLPICSVAKGLENKTLLYPTQILRDALGGSPDAALPVAALAGPCIAPEVVRTLPATVTVACQNPALAEQVQRLFTRPYFRVYTNDDVLGTEIAAATKNIIAIAAGILDGLQAGDNAKAALITRGLSEIRRLGLAMGARAETFAGLAGVGDLVTTCISPVGRNRTFGQTIGQGATVQEALEQTHGTVEGLATTESVVALAARQNVEMPITLAVHEVLFCGKAPAKAIADLMNRPLKSEI